MSFPNKSRRLLCAVASMLMSLAVCLQADAAPKRVVTAAGSDCVACHGSDKVLNAKHKSVKDMTWTDCTKCHEPRTESTLAGRLPMAHAHLLSGRGCESCHGKGEPKAIEFEKCVSCHDADKTVAKSAGVKPKNPHTSPHYGKDLDCTNCHIAHGKSENYCNQCHKFNFVVP